MEQTFTSTKPNLNADSAQEREPVRYARAQASVSICEDRGVGAARLLAGKVLENCAFRYGKATDFDCHRVEYQFPGGSWIESTTLSSGLRRSRNSEFCKTDLGTRSDGAIKLNEYNRDLLPTAAKYKRQHYNKEEEECSD